MITIKRLEIKRKYRYVWLKYVRDFNLSQHCARCLIGTYDERVNKDTLTYTDLVLPPSPYYYFCTVYQYDTNIHLAFIEAPGEVVEIDDPYYYVRIENARRIRFDDSRIDRSLPQAAKREFSTCRNWQFANWIVNGKGY
jgi:hypothetical protein